MAATFGFPAHTPLHTHNISHNMHNTQTLVSYRGMCVRFAWFILLLHCNFPGSSVMPALCDASRAAGECGNNSCCLYGNKCQASFRQQHQQRKLIFLNASMVACGVDGNGRWGRIPPTLSFTPLGCLCFTRQGLKLRIVFLITVKHSSET